MKYLATAILLSVTTLAAADDLQVAKLDQDLLLARSEAPIRAIPLPEMVLRGETSDAEEGDSQAIWSEPLNTVSATLEFELRNRLKAEFAVR